MTIRRLAGTAVAMSLTFGIAAIAPATGHAQSALSLPGEHGEVTLTGCFGWIHDQGYVLTKPMMGPTYVPQETCLVSQADYMVKLRDDLKKNGLTKTMLGRFVTVSGTMGDSYESKKHRPDRPRKLYVEAVAIPPVMPPAVAAVRESQTFTEVPVTQPPPPAVTPAPMPMPEQPVGTTGTMRRALPKTATSLPLVGLIGFLSLAGALALHLLGQRNMGRA